MSEENTGIYYARALQEPPLFYKTEEFGFMLILGFGVLGGLILPNLNPIVGGGIISTAVHGLGVGWIVKNIVVKLNAGDPRYFACLFKGLNLAGKRVISSVVTDREALKRR